MAYIGNSPANIQRGRRAIYEFTSTAGQTAYSGLDDNNQVLDLLEANEQSVFLNGIRLIPTDDYTVSGDTLTLTSAASVNDLMVIETQAEVGNAVTYTRTESDARYVNYNGDVISGNVQIVGSLTATDLAVDTDVLVVDATNNRVGIGTSSPNYTLDIASSGTLLNMNSTNSNGIGTVYRNSGTAIGYVGSSKYIHSGTIGDFAIGTASTNNLTFGINSSEKMRIDSSGILLVGKNSSNYAIEGMELSSVRATFTRDGGNPLLLNRLSSDGDLAVFYKDSTTVGSIGSVSGALYIGSPNGSDAFIKFNNNAITPATSSGAHRDNAIDLGANPVRFKDLYLSNAVRLGNANLQEINGTDPFLSGNAYWNGSTWNYLTSTDATNYYQADGQHIWRTAASGTADAAVTWSEAMRIDASGNLLVSKTIIDNTTDGHRFDASGFMSHVRDGNAIALYNRKTSDGDIVLFRKDGADVGSVATYGGDLIVGTGDTRLRFVDSLDSVLPVSNSTGTSRDAGIDLGHSETRFKDIYTSGGIYLGAASSSTPVAANKLDDYEEGLHTYTLKGANSGNATIPIRSGYTKLAYTKIGRMVTVTGKIETSGSHSATGALRLSLPFTAANLSDQAGVAGGSCFIYRTSQSIYDNPAILANTTSPYAIFYYNTTSGDVAAINANNLDAAFEILVSFSYFTNS